MLRLMKKKHVLKEAPPVKTVAVFYDTQHVTLLRRRSSEAKKSNIDTDTVDVVGLPLETRLTLNQMECLYALGLLSRKDWDDVRPVVVKNGLDMVRDDVDSQLLRAERASQIEQHERDFLWVMGYPLPQTLGEVFTVSDPFAGEGSVSFPPNDGHHQNARLPPASVHGNPFDDEHLLSSATLYVTTAS